MDNIGFEKYKVEACGKWGETEAYKQYKEKAKNYSAEKQNTLAEGMDNIFGEFALCMKNGGKTDSDEAIFLVKKLKDYISENYYLCTNEILAGLGRMYVCDERFTKNIDKHTDGTALFVSKAINFYCKDI